jgi:oligosaccharyltransferase complex subunit gamma
MFNPSWKEVAKAWRKTPKVHQDDHFFATLDFDEGQAVFVKLGLQSAPVVHIYPATEGPRKTEGGKTSPIKFDFSSGFDPQPLADQLSNYTPVKIPYSPPINWSKWITVAIGVLGTILSARFIAPVLTNRWSWAAMSVIVSLVMTSGYMFTRIRASPWSGGEGQWIAAGYQNQFGQEVQVVSMIYGVLATAFLMLIIVTPRQASPQRQRAQVYLWTAVIMIIYSVLVSLFRVKNRGYPFKLFL